MPTYIVFNRKTGEPVQTHHHPEDLPVSREWLLAITDPGHNRDELDVTIVDHATIKMDREHHVDVTSGKLQVVKVGKIRGFGTTGASRGPRPGSQGPTRTVFERHPPESSGSK
jgi:hypothetical protein